MGSYQSWSVVFGEQPSAAKWGILGTNDAAFNDGSGFNISNPITAASTSHIELTPGTSKFVKIAVLRQDDTTNTYKNKSVILSGWGVHAPGAAGVKTETITFGITFDQRPIVVGCSGGDNSSGTATLGAGTRADQNNYAEVHTVLTTGFSISNIAVSNWAAGTTVFYHWIAIGEITA